MDLRITPTKALGDLEAQLRHSPDDAALRRRWQAEFLQCVHAANLMARRLCCMCTVPGRYSFNPVTHMITLQWGRGGKAQRLLCTEHHAIQMKVWRRQAKKGELVVAEDVAVDPAKDVSYTK